MRSRKHCALVYAIALAAGCVGLTVRAQQSVISTGDLQVTVLSTMLADAIDDEAYSSFGEWGFSALVGVGGNKYLYDTGYHSELVLQNAEKLGIDLAEVEQVVLSHAHVDHIGGLLTLRRTLMAKNPNAISTVHVAAGFLAEAEDPGGSDRDEAAAIIDAFRATGGEVIVHIQPSEIAPGVWLSGPVPRIHDERNWSESARILSGGEAVEDTIPEDMSLIIETADGLVVISGCGHAGIVNIADHALSLSGRDRVVAAVGGFHLFEATDETLEWTAVNFKRIGLTYFIAAHCTGVEAALRLRELAGLRRENAVVGAVGQRYTRDGIYPGWIAH